VYLFEDTVENNIRFGRPDASEDEIIAVAKKACCHDFIMTLPDGYQTKIGEGGSSLSGGEKQRVSLIRNLQFLPRVLLLDEITSALDESNKHNVNEMIHRYVREQNIAVLWVTHDKDEINHADKVITLQPHAGEMQEARYELA